MKPEAQNIAIGGACGLRWAEPTPLNECIASRGYWTSNGTNRILLPDYLNDLNAMHEAEKVLTYEQVNLFVTHLRGFTPAKNWEGCWGLHATAAQRAEAFLRTLNLWDDSK